jgi:hypothetical protein
MTETNFSPYEAPAEVATDPLESTSAKNPLVKAFAIAPLVGPTFLALFVLIGGVIYLSLNPENPGTPVGVIVIPIFTMTVGVFLSYCAALVVGLPMALVLRRRNQLNGWTIHAAAWTCAVLMTGLGCLASFAASSNTSLGVDVIGWLVVLALLTPGSLLSGTAFWWIMRRDQRHSRIGGTHAIH